MVNNNGPKYCICDSMPHLFAIHSICIVKSPSNAPQHMLCCMTASVYRNTCPIFPAPTPPTPCQLKTETRRLTFNTSDGDFCQSPGELPLTRCEGACNGYDGLRVKAWWSETESDHECKCCTGIGRYEPRTVQCANHGETTVDVMVYQQCVCSACAGGD